MSFKKKKLNYCLITNVPVQYTSIVEHCTVYIITLSTLSIHTEHSAQLQHLYEQNNITPQLTCAFSVCLEETRLEVEDFEKHIFFG